MGAPPATTSVWPLIQRDRGPTRYSTAAATSSIDPQTLSQLPDEVRDGIVTAYADALAPVFWYLVPFIALAFLLSLFLKQIPLSDVAGLVARGEAVGGDEAEELDAAARGGARAAHAGVAETAQVGAAAATGTGAGAGAATTVASAAEGPDQASDIGPQRD